MRCACTFHLIIHRVKAHNVLSRRQSIDGCVCHHDHIGLCQGQGWQTHCRCGSGDGVVDLQLGEQSSERVIKRVNLLHVLLLVEKAAYQ